MSDPERPPETLGDRPDAVDGVDGVDDDLHCEYDAAAFARFLHAGGRPDWAWFQGLSERDQSLVAEQGRLYRMDVVADLVRALSDPTGFQLDEFPEEAASEDLRLARIAGSAIADIMGQSGIPSGAPESPMVTPDHPPRRTMSGALQRTEEAIQERKEAYHGQRLFLGRLPTRTSIIE